MPRKGEYGFSVLAQPQILEADKVSVIDGKRLVGNGKALVAALVELQGEVKQMSSEPDWLTPRLKQDLSS